MPGSSADEKRYIGLIVDKLTTLRVRSDREWTILLSRKPLRYRQIDVRASFNGEDIWVEIDGPNHRGERNHRRDDELAAAAQALHARLLHWPLWLLILEGITPLIDAALDGMSTNLGHADARPYRVWQPWLDTSRREKARGEAT